MASSPSTVSKPLIVALIVVVVLAIAYFAYSAMNKNAGEVVDVPKKPDNVGPVSPEDAAKGPQPEGYGKTKGG